jgi:hypothetical protein
MIVIEDQLRDLALIYRKKLQDRMAEREQEMLADDTSHHLIYQLLGVPPIEGNQIDLYQNMGRFLYRYAGAFLENASKLCFITRFPNAVSTRIPNPFGRRPATFEIDCLIEQRAYEIKWRDATADGDHIMKEHTRIRAIAHAGYQPIRLMYYYPNRAQAIKIQSAIADLYRANGGHTTMRMQHGSIFRR